MDFLTPHDLILIFIGMVIMSLWIELYTRREARKTAVKPTKPPKHWRYDFE